ncbi:MAG TPA: carboxypeptidase-like regulatory domain-containing protein, partial [Pyrinomonadaceae bacterium]|nr:carboxypeptidase-like regulatory domain-containing protein [Pyrinomonadaceae bacterium]
MNKLFGGLVLLLLSVFCLVSVQAQTSGRMSGTVTDPNGAVMAGANVTVRNNNNGAERSTTTNESGLFNLDALQPGMYTVTIETKGFKKAVAPDIKVDVSSNAQVNVSLEIGVESETVTVTASQEVINTASPTLTNVINTRQIVDLPLPDRNPLGLAALQAGIAVIGTDTRGSSVAGLRQTATNVTQDGINAMDNFVKTSSFFAISTPSLNSTAEFSITTGTTSSEAGRGVAQVNMVTRSGSNDFHGGAFYQMINEAYNANTFFNNFNGIARPMLRQSYWGGDIGGPVYFPNFGDGGPRIFDGKDTAFFFFSYERFDQKRAAARNRNGVLGADARNGIFSYRCAATSTDPLCPANTVKTINLLTLASTPFHTLNPLMTAHLAQIPLPNNTNCTASDGFNIGCYAFNVPELTVNNK